MGLAVLAATWWGLRPRRLVVEGASMRPTLQPGDRLLATRAARVRVGDVVAVADPRRPERLLVKRVAATGPDGLAVAGDNPVASTDSRQFGPVRRAAIAGTVRYRYHPRARAGRLRRARR